MTSFRSAIALLLLAALAAGGTVAPVVHGALHAEETVEARAHTEHATDGHHHHEAGDDHGQEALPPCPEPLETHLTCVLFAPATAVFSLRRAALVAPSAVPLPAPWRAALPASDGLAVHGPRGPPALV
ncbi:MAG TPA: hypothetical protein EYQ24_02745 [Bacteroidetes bacterium]|nr:hypothetical protein [Bacteroidota bacterium]HIL57992.1 hypothetical protein [Rhodothermales bacterium]